MNRAIDRVRADLAAGFALLTRIPVGWLAPRNAEWPGARAVWTYPLVGLLIGAVSAGCVWCARRAGVPPDLGAVWAVAISVLLIGGIHEDGLADTADGFGGGRTPERRLEIMRDSRIGSYGALALVLSVAVRIIAIGGLPIAKAGASLLVASALSRSSMIPVMILLRPARRDGLGNGIGRISMGTTILAIAIASGTAFIFLPAVQAILALAAVCATSLMVSATARNKIGGYTGDVLGACCVVSECVLLTVLVAT